MCIILYVLRQGIVEMRMRSVCCTCISTRILAYVCRATVEFEERAVSKIRY